MKFSSSLSDVQNALVVDTSVIINLQHSGIGKEIVELIENQFVVAEYVGEEVEKESAISRYSTALFLRELIDLRLIKIVSLSVLEQEIYYKLSIAEMSLGDGEKATIAIANSRGYTSVIDERKGRKVAEKELNGKVVATSLDVIFYPNVQKKYEVEKLAEAVYLALRVGNMSIQAAKLEFVIDLIGKERASHCTCLPRYKSLKEEWEIFN